MSYLVLSSSPFFLVIYCSLHESPHLCCLRGLYLYPTLKIFLSISLITTSEIGTSCMVAEADGITPLQAVHTGFGLGGAERQEAKGTESPLKS